MFRTDFPVPSDFNYGLGWQQGPRSTVVTNEVKSAIVAIGIPFVGVLSGIVYFAGSEATVFGFPIVFAWLFLWMPLTSICLHLAWTLFDREEHEAAERTDGSADAEIDRQP